MSNMDKPGIEKLVRSKSERVTFHVNKGQSPVWPSFVLIKVDNELVQYVMCVNCNAVLRWQSRSGTNGLQGHINSCKGTTTTVAVTEMFKKMPGPFTYNGSEKTISAGDKHDLADAMAMMCAKDIRPFSTVEGDGFKAFARKLVELCGKYGGKVSVDDALPCARTVSRHLGTLAKAQKITLASELANVWRLAVTSDLWTHEATTTPYITVTVHYINSEWQLCAKVLATRPMEEKHTADNIRTVITAILTEFDANRPSNVYVTDNGANIKAAFKSELWVSCSGHNLNLTVSHALDDKQDEGPLSSLTRLVATCKEIVTRVKRTHIQSKLETTVKQVVATRWNSTLTMLKSVHINLLDLKLIADELNDRPLLKLLHNVADDGHDLLKSVIEVLEPFDDATRLVSADKSPTLHLVLAVRIQLMKHVVVKSGDCEAIVALKTQLETFLASHFRINPLHNSAALLDPRLKGNRTLMSSEERKEAIETLRKMVMEVTTDEPEPSSTPRTTAPSTKKPRAVHSFFGNLFENSGAPLVNEVHSYMSCADLTDDILEFWKGKSEQWPRLACVARLLLAVPATETSSERVFSLAGRTLEDRRTQLSAEAVDDLLFLHGLHKS